MADEDVAEITLGLTVAVVARRVGVAPATLRTWNADMESVQVIAPVEDIVATA